MNLLLCFKHIVVVVVVVVADPLQAGKYAGWMIMEGGTVGYFS